VYDRVIVAIPQEREQGRFGTLGSVLSDGLDDVLEHTRLLVPAMTSQDAANVGGPGWPA
jgi:hypothetical protein